MNPEQRAAVRAPVLWMRFMATQLRRGRSVAGAYDAGIAAGLCPVTLVHGPGGTGKSEVIHVLARFVEQHGYGRMAITTQTGVAAAQFLAPTLQRLVSIGAYKGVPTEDLTAEQVTAAKKQFADECGFPIEELVLFVCDEISFVSTSFIGLVDKWLRQLKGVARPFGGVAVVFAGDMHQLPPCGGVLWCADLVQVALERGVVAPGDAGAGGPVVGSRDRGLVALRST